jgi:hypothetical protein
MTETRKKVVMIDTSKPLLVVKGDQVVEVPPVEVAEELEAVEDSVKPQHHIKLEGGKEAVYEYYADCVDCAAEGKEMPVFVCKTHPIRADEMMGNQLAGFWNDGGGISTPLCMRHYAIRLGNIPKSDPSVEYKVLERTW